jgi:acetyl esterase/lipase
MLDDTLRYAEKTKCAGTKTTVSVYEEAPHVFPLLHGIPEADEAIAEIAHFLKST